MHKRDARLGRIIDHVFPLTRAIHLALLAGLLLLSSCASSEAQTAIRSREPAEGGVSSAVSDVSAPQDKIAALVKLLDDPDVRSWIRSLPPETGLPASASPALVDPVSMDAVAAHLTRWENLARSDIDAVFSAVPRIPDAFVLAFQRLSDDAQAQGFGPMVLLVAAVVLAAIVVEKALLHFMRRGGSGVHEFLPVAAFSVTMAVLFFAFEWPPLGRVVVACFLSAFVVYRVSAIAMGLTAHPSLRRRLKAMMGLVVAGVATLIAVSMLEMERPVRHAIAYLLSCILLALVFEALWSRPHLSKGVRIATTFYVVGLWLLWALDFRSAFWLGCYAVILPPILRSVGHLVHDHVTSGPGAVATDTRAVLLVRGSRAAIVAVAVAWIAFVWNVGGRSAFQDNPQYTAIFHGLLNSIIVLLLADIVWHLVRAAIDRRAAPPAEDAPDAISHEAHATRLLTLLPILRNVVAVVLLVVAALIVLAQLGVEIAPLIAGAGVVGVAIGFGSQALVKDVISGFFYLFDDAFRVGEYIQAKTYKGTVEGFSLRSVKLRHHRGPIFTIPFGELGAVENMSRDWSKAKFRITVPYDTDLEKARRIGKLIGQQLADDPEFGSVFIQPLKMKGVEDFGEYGIVISFAMITVPTSQSSFIRRKAHAMLRDAFQANGIVFAQPTVNIGGAADQTGNAAAASELRRMAKETATAGREN